MCASAKYWLRVLSEIKNRGVADVCMLVCDGLKGLPDAVSAVWEKTIVQTCIVHLLRNSFKYASKKDWGVIAKDLKPVYTAASEAEALDRFADFSGKWEKRYPAIIRLWENAWAEFVPFLRFDREIRTVICTTNAIESINARLRRAVNARGHFPTEQAAMKCLYLAIMRLDPTGKGRYAESSVMPTCPSLGWPGLRSGLCCRDYLGTGPQLLPVSLSRKSSMASVGWYRPGGVPSAVARSSAFLGHQVGVEVFLCRGDVLVADPSRDHADLVPACAHPARPGVPHHLRGDLLV